MLISLRRSRVLGASGSGPGVSSGITHFPPEIDVNPYMQLFYRALAPFGFELVPDAQLTLRWLLRTRRRVRILHFHWCPNNYYEHEGSARFLSLPASWLALIRFIGLLAGARLLGYRIVWTVHEVLPHTSSSRRIDRLAARALARLSNVLLAHDRPTAERARRELGRAAARVEIVPHGSYGGFYAPGRSRALVREELDIPPGSFAFLAFGSLKPYKRIELLLEAFRSLELPEATLVIAGNCQPRFQKIADAVLAAAGRDLRVKVRLGLLPDERVAELYAACDAAVLSRSDGWTSGSLVLALSQGLPVIAAAMPAYEELTGGGAAGWHFRSGDPQALRAAMETAARNPQLASSKGRAGLSLAESLSWEEAASRVAWLLAAADPVPRARPLARATAP